MGPSKRPRKCSGLTLFSPPLLANWQLSKPGKQLFKFLLSTVTACPAPELLAPYCSLVSRSNWIEGFTGMAFQTQILKLCLESFPTFCLLNTDYPDIWQSGSIIDLKSWSSRKVTPMGDRTLGWGGGTVTSLKCLYPWSSCDVLERAVVLEPDRPEFEFLFFSPYKLCSVASISSFPELTIVMNWMDVKIPESR